MSFGPNPGDNVEINESTDDGHPFTPDWCVAPAGTLDEFITDMGLNVRTMALRCATHEAQITTTMQAIVDVLERKPLTEVTAILLEHGSGIPARFWLALEKNYRDGLAAGLTDTSHGLDSWPPRASFPPGSMPTLEDGTPDLGGSRGA
jgi:plasmid maintenance system antidote protein VapI